MQVLQVKEYNRLQEIKYDKDRKEWDCSTGGFPQVAFYLFFTSYGSERKTGFVAFENHKAVWRRTKKEAIEAFNN